MHKHTISGITILLSSIIPLSSVVAASGTITVESHPSGLPFVVEDSSGTQTRGITPAKYHGMNAGVYRLSSRLQEPCTQIAPISRYLRPGELLAFEFETQCSELTGIKPKREVESRPVRNFRLRSRETVQPSIRPLLTSNIQEVLPGGVVRFQLELKSQSSRPLRNITLHFSYDDFLLDVERIVGSQSGRGYLSFHIPILAPHGKWEQEIQGIVNAESPNAELSATLTVSGDPLATLPYSERSSTTSIAVISQLPETGRSETSIPFFLVTLAGFVLCRRPPGRRNVFLSQTK